MRLSKRCKFNMIIAILLCMAFVVNIGATLATINYRLNVSSVNTNSPSVDTNTFVEFASAESAKGDFEYGYGVRNNQLSINYGFSSTIKYDLMIKFTAVYTDTEGNNGSNKHLVNDFTINFVNRDMWCVDMGSINGWITKNGELTEDDKKYYLTGASVDGQGDPAPLSGVMYYMGQLSGSGSLPVISGVTFHTSPNNSYVFLGDKLTITLTPVYVKSNADNYTASHTFASNVIDDDAFKNWYQYMAVKAGKQVDGWGSRAMIYNAYVDSKRCLNFPYDESVMTTQTTTDANDNPITQKVVNTSLKTQPNYSNTAYRYNVTQEDGKTVRRFDAITAGNRYNGGLGVYVIPASDLLTISVSFNYSWYNWETQELAGTTSSLMVMREYSNEFQIISTAQGDYRYYKGTIDSPIYIDILKYIRLTAEDSKTIITGGYSLLLNDVSIGFVTSSTLKTDQRGDSYNWTGEYERPNYAVVNSTLTSPILARVTHVATGLKNYDTDITITNNDKNPININGFTVTSKLWYGYYADASANFAETLMGDGYLPNTGLIYDTTLWEIEDYTNGVFTFALQEGKSVYIPSGYSLTLISGVQIPATPACQSASVANDFWCTLEVSFDTETQVTPEVDIDDTIDYSKSSSTSVEVITEGYYTAINDDIDGKIYIRNNSQQVITGVTLSNLTVYILNDESQMISRDKATANNAEHTLTNHVEGTVSIKPGEMVLAYTISPTTANENAIISSFDISVTLQTITEESTAIPENSDIDLLYNQSINIGTINNNSEKYYEFRLVSTTDLSSKLYNANDFVAKPISSTEFHYYYKGIICPNRSVRVLKEFAPNVVVDYLEHDKTKGEERYTDENYSAWGLDEDVEKDLEWLTFMKNLYQGPTIEERKEATIVA